MKRKGDKLEIFVENLFRDLGKKRVRRNKTYNKRGFRAQIDLVYGLCRPTFVECKHYSSHVSYKEFMKFVGVCNRLKPKRRIMVTSSDFDGRCYHDADKYGIELINGHKLHKMYKKSRFLPSKKSLNQLIHENGKYPYSSSIKRKAVDFSKYGLYFAMSMAIYENWEPIVESIKNLF